MEELDLDPYMMFMVAHLLRQPEVTRAAINRVDIKDFNSYKEANWQLMWGIAQEFHKQNGVIPPKEYFLSIGQHRLSELVNDQKVNNNYMIDVDTVFAIDGLTEKWGRQLVEDFLKKRRMVNEMHDIAERPMPPREKLHMWQEVMKKQASCEFTASNDVMPFADPMQAMFGVAPRDLLGVPFLDEMMFGGSRPGELVGFLAPSGGGKTTLSNQILIEGAKRDRKGALLTYEQPPDNEYMVAVYACATGIGRDVWESVRSGTPLSDQIAADQETAFKEACRMISQNLIYSDMSSGRAGGGGVYEIQNKIIDLRRKLGRLDTLVLDWFWPIVVRGYDNMSLQGGKRMDLRNYAQGFLSDLKAMLAAERVFCWLPHQLKPDEASKNRLMTFEDAAELKSFAWYMNGCFCTGKMDTDQCCTINYAKARNARPDKCVVKLHGNLARFVRIDGDMVYDSRQGKHVKSTEINSVPQSNGNRREEYAARPNAEGAGSF